MLHKAKTPVKKTEPVSVLLEDRTTLAAIAAATNAFPYEHVHAALQAYLIAHPRLAAVARAALAVTFDGFDEASTVGVSR